MFLLRFFLSRSILELQTFFGCCKTIWGIHVRSPASEGWNFLVDLLTMWRLLPLLIACRTLVKVHPSWLAYHFIYAHIATWSGWCVGLGYLPPAFIRAVITCIWSPPDRALISLTQNCGFGTCLFSGFLSEAFAITASFPNSERWKYSFVRPSIWVFLDLEVKAKVDGPARWNGAVLSQYSEHSQELTSHYCLWSRSMDLLVGYLRQLILLCWMTIRESPFPFSLIL